MSDCIHVWRDTYGAYEHVGLIEAVEDHATFRYDESYAGPAISVRMPVRDEPFSERDTEIFFSALVPEGQTRFDFLDALRAGRNEYTPLLGRLNDESSGGLVFTAGDREPGVLRAYMPLDADAFERLARSPEPQAPILLARLASRLPVRWPRLVSTAIPRQALGFCPRALPLPPTTFRQAITIFSLKES